MSTDYKISNLIEQQFPDYFRTDGANLVAFVKAYYEWMEQSNNAIEVSKNLLNYQDIDKTYDKYLDFFQKEILSSIPKDIIVDRKLLAKHIQSLYRSRGSELSYKLLFRILFNEEISFYYPGEDILRASDGRWLLEIAIRVADPITGNTNSLEGEIITGLTSGAQARVQRIELANESGVDVIELFVSNIVGEFIDGEIVRANDNSFTGTIFSLSGPLQAVDVTNGGALHFVGDKVRFTTDAGASGATGEVVATSDTSAVEWTLVYGGNGYTLGTEITITDNGGFNTDFEITGITIQESIGVNEDTIEPFQNVVLNTGPTFVSAGANTSSVSANLASSNVSSYLNSALSFPLTQVGTITSIATLNRGYGYSTLPTAQVVEPSISDQNLSDGIGGFKGRNAVIVANNVAGAITQVDVEVFGSGYGKFDEVNIINTSRTGTENAAGDSTVSGVVNFPGRYTDTKGFLSWNNKLQDNYYYQEFSYVISSENFLETYEKLINTTVHPIGTKLFSSVRLWNDSNVAELGNLNIETDDLQITP